MAQVLDNLLSNAIRHTPSGGSVTLRARLAAGEVQLLVADSGTGIPPAELARIFDRFYRADKARQRREEGGSGLGLAIARSIVLAHNGRIWAESEPGQGTTIIVALAAAESDG